MNLLKRLYDFFHPKSAYDRGYDMAMQELEDCPDERLKTMKANLRDLSCGEFNTTQDDWDFDRGVADAVNDWEAK